MSSYPNADELLAGVEQYLKDTVVPSLADTGVRFRTRVAAHLIGTARRELELGSDNAARELAGLNDLRRLPPPPTELQSESQRIEWLNENLAQRLQAGDIPLDDHAVFKHLLKTLGDQLNIVQPRFDQDLHCENSSK